MTRASLRSDPRLRGRGRHRSPWTPRRLAPRAWYDAELGQPKYVGYVQLNGGSTDNISTPDSALNSFSNDIEVIMRVRPDDWTTGATQTLCGKYLTTGNQRSWRFYVSAAGAIGLTVSVDGTAVTTIAVTPTTPFVDATWIWLRLRLDLTNGVNSVGTIDIAADTGNNYTIPTLWTANGTNTGTTLAGIYNGTGAVEIGSFNSGTSERLAGRVGRCIVKTGFDGTTTSDFNADDCFGDGYTHTDGYRWTLGLPKVYDRSGNNHPPAVFGAGSNQPKWLPWDGTPSVYLPGVTGNYVVAPTSTDYNIAADMEVVVRVSLDRYASASTAGFLSRFDGPSGATRAFTFRWLQNVGPEFVWNDTGTASIRAVNTGMSPWLFAVDGETYWFKVEFDADNGAGGCTARFYVAFDMGSEPTSGEWILVAEKTLATVASIAASTFPLVVGSDAVTVRSAAGGVHCAVLRDGIGGTVLAHFDAAKCGQNGYADTIGSVGPVWTVNRSTTGRKTVVQSGAAKSARSVILLGTDDYIDVPNTAIPALDTFAAASSVIESYRLWHATAGVMFATKNSIANNVLGTAFRFNAGMDYAVVSGDGVGSDGAFPTYGSALGNRFITSLFIGNTTPFVSARTNFDAAITDAVKNTVSTTSTGLAGRIGAFLDGSFAQNMEFEGLITLDDAVSAIDHSRAVEYYNGGL